MNGYISIDCKKLNLLAQDSQTISGLYADCIAAMETNKLIIAVNCEYGEGVPMSPISVMGIIEAGVCIFTASILQIRVASDDTVTIVPLINTTSKSKK